MSHAKIAMEDKLINVFSVIIIVFLHKRDTVVAKQTLYKIMGNANV